MKYKVEKEAQFSGYSTDYANRNKYEPSSLCSLCAELINSLSEIGQPCWNKALRSGFRFMFERLDF